jgi:hypothetical protein
MKAKLETPGPGTGPEQRRWFKQGGVKDRIGWEKSSREQRFFIFIFLFLFFCPIYGTAGFR